MSVLRKIVLALAVLAAAAAAASARAASPPPFTDPAGDSVTAPDIRAVAATGNGNGTVVFSVQFAGGIAADAALMLFVDADRNSSTGSEVGAEFMVWAGAEGAGLLRWSGSDFVAFDHAPLSPTLDSDRLGFTLKLADLGTTSFDYVVGSARGDDVDLAPDSGVYTYPRVAEIRMIIVPASVLVPKAGSRLVVPRPQLRLSDDSVVTADSVTGTLTFKGRALPPSGNCIWKIPKSYRGKTLVLKLTASYGGESRQISVPVSPR